MDRVFHATHAGGGDGIAGGIGTGMDGEAAAAEGEHFGHEGKAVERAMLVEGGENFFDRAHFDPVAAP